MDYWSEINFIIIIIIIIIKIENQLEKFDSFVLPDVLVTVRCENLLC
jgi:hypothetical protein